MKPTHDETPIIIIEQGGDVVLIYSDGRRVRIAPDGALVVEPSTEPVRRAHSRY